MVFVDDGTTVKSQVVSDIMVTGADATTDMVSGTATGEPKVHVWENSAGNTVKVLAAPGGTWDADFSAVPLTWSPARKAAPQSSMLTEIRPRWTGWLRFRCWWWMFRRLVRWCPGSSVVMSGLVTDDGGVGSVRVAVYDRDRLEWWNGSGGRVCM